MSNLTRSLGQRLRNIRLSRGYSQEKLAELAGFHHTYIGQVERGEKNVTVETLERIAASLGVTLSSLFETPGENSGEKSYALLSYELIADMEPDRQKKTYRIIKELYDL